LTNSPAAAANQATNSAAPFTDISNDPNRVFITYLSQLGIVGGFPDGKFSPQLGLSRAQVAVIICKASKLTITPGSKNTFRDVAPNHWAAPYVYTASTAGLLKGFPDGTFRPEATLTRAQGISLIMRLCTQKERASLPSLQDMTSQHWAAQDMATALSLDMISTSPDGKQVNPDAEMTRAVLARSLAILLTKDPGLNQTELAGGLKEITGDVTLSRNNKPESIKNDIVVYEGDIIKTGLDSRARIVYPDGSGTLIEANSEIVIKKAAGKSYIKQDGTAGVAVDYLNIELKSGTLFGALSTKSENITNDKQASRSAIFASKQTLKQLAAAETAQPWYKTAEQKKVKVKVDMPWGIAAIRGTFIKVSVNPNGTCDVACLTGSAEVSGSNGASAPLGGGQSSSITTQGSAPTNAAPMSQEDKAAFAQEQAWVVNTALLVDTNKAAEVLVETKENQTVEQQTENTVKTVIDALKASGIQLKPEVIDKLKDDIQKTLNDEKAVLSLTKDVETSTSNNSNPNTNTNSSSSSSSDSNTYIAYNTAGTYGGESSSAIQTLSGSAIINVAGVTLHNLIITGTLTLASGIGEGNITLQNVTVRGNTVINGGGPNSIEIIDSSLYTVTIDKANNSIRIVAKGNTSIGALTLNSGATLQEDGLSGNGTGFFSVLTGLNIPAGATIILSGSFDSLTLNAPGCKVTLANGTDIQGLTANVAATIGGEGRIVNAVINAAGVTLDQVPANISMSNGIAASIAGQSLDASIFSGATGCIAGRVVDSGGQGIAGAAVIAHIGTASPIISPATTVSNGSFILTGLSPVTYNLEIIPPVPGTAVTPVFYIPFSLSGVNVTAGKITTVSPDIVIRSTTVIPLTAVAIYGDPVVGSTLTALPAPANATATYSWKVDGAPTGTGPTYLVTANDAGKTITVTATGAGNFNGTVTTNAVSITAIPLSAVVISGNPAAGSTLAAVLTPANATATYSWLVGGIPAGTDATYLVTANDAGKTIIVTATGTGSFSGTATSSVIINEPLAVWSSITTLPRNLNSLSVGVGNVMAVGSGGQAYMSIDGINWSPQNTGSAGDYLLAAAYGDTKYVAVGFTGCNVGIIKYLNDGGSTWTDVSPSGAGNVTSIYHGGPTGGDFLATSGKTIYHSTDGVTWIPQVTDLSNNGIISSITYGNGVFVAVGSDSPSDWTQQYPIAFTSADGVNWDRYNLTSANAGKGPGFSDVTFVNGKFIALESIAWSGGNLPRYAYTSTNGINWSSYFATPSSMECFNSCTNNGDTIIINSDQGLYKSPNAGETWSILPALSKPILDMTYFKDGFIGVGPQGGLRCGSGGGGSGTNTTMLSNLSGSNPSFDCDTNTLSLDIDQTTYIPDSDFNIKKITISDGSHSFTLQDEYSGVSTNELYPGDYYYNSDSHTLSIHLTDNDYGKLLMSATSLYAGLGAGPPANIQVSAAAGWNTHFALGDAAATALLPVTIANWNSYSDTIPPSAVTINQQDTIAAGSFRILSVADGPLSIDSWNNIFNTIKSYTGINGAWISGINAAELSMKLYSGNAICLYNNSSATAVINSDFYIPKTQVIDLAGNQATKDMIIDSCTTVTSLACGIQYGTTPVQAGVEGTKERVIINVVTQNLIKEQQRINITGTATGAGNMTINLSDSTTAYGETPLSTSVTVSLTDGESVSAVIYEIMSQLALNTDFTSRYQASSGASYIDITATNEAGPYRAFAFATSYTGLTFNQQTMVNGTGSFTVRINDGVLYTNNQQTPDGVEVAINIDQPNTSPVVIAQKIASAFNNNATIKAAYVPFMYSSAIYIEATDARDNRNVAVTFTGNAALGIYIQDPSSCGGTQAGEAGVPAINNLTIIRGAESAANILVGLNDGSNACSKVVPVQAGDSSATVATAIYNALKDSFPGYSVTNPSAGVVTFTQTSNCADISFEANMLALIPDNSENPTAPVCYNAFPYRCSMPHTNDMALQVQCSSTGLASYVIVDPAVSIATPSVTQVLNGLDGAGNPATRSGLLIINNQSPYPAGKVVIDGTLTPVLKMVPLGEGTPYYYNAYVVTISAAGAVSNNVYTDSDVFAGDPGC